MKPPSYSFVAILFPDECLRSHEHCKVFDEAQNLFTELPVFFNWVETLLGQIFQTHRVRSVESRVQMLH